MPVGMNTNGIYYPQLSERAVLAETASSGYSRIEISYYMKDDIDNHNLYDGCFTRDCQFDIDTVLMALSEVGDLCHRVPMMSLF